MVVTFAPVRASRIGVALELEGTVKEGLDERLCQGRWILRSYKLTRITIRDDVGDASHSGRHDGQAK